MTLTRKKQHFTGLTTTLCVCALTISITAGIAGADVFTFVDSGNVQNWTNAHNWKGSTKQGLPATEDEVRINSATLEITTAVTVSYLKNGVEGPAKVIIDGGSLLAVGKDMYNSAGFKRPGTLIITNGGSATFCSYLIVGYSNVTGSAVLINDGSLRVTGVYFHNIYYKDAMTLDTRTTINTGGLLEVGTLKLNAGVMNIAGGIVIIKTVGDEEVRQWIDEGRIIAMGGKKGWKVKTTNDPVTGYFVMTAESTSTTPATAVNVAQEPTRSGSTKIIIIGVTTAGPVLLLAFFLLKKRKKSKKMEPASGPKATYDF